MEILVPAVSPPVPGKRVLERMRLTKFDLPRASCLGVGGERTARWPPDGDFFTDQTCVPLLANVSIAAPSPLINYAVTVPRHARDSNSERGCIHRRHFAPENPPVSARDAAGNSQFGNVAADCRCAAAAGLAVGSPRDFPTFRGVPLSPYAEIENHIFTKFYEIFRNFLGCIQEAGKRLETVILDFENFYPRPFAKTFLCV